jgi:hypothetical protein
LVFWSISPVILPSIFPTMLLVQALMNCPWCHNRYAKSNSGFKRISNKNRHDTLGQWSGHLPGRNMLQETKRMLTATRTKSDR